MSTLFDKNKASRQDGWMILFVRVNEHWHSGGECIYNAFTEMLGTEMWLSLLWIPFHRGRFLPRCLLPFPVALRCVMRYWLQEFGVSSHWRHSIFEWFCNASKRKERTERIEPIHVQLNLHGTNGRLNIARIVCVCWLRILDTYRTVLTEKSFLLFGLFWG